MTGALDKMGKICEAFSEISLDIAGDFGGASLQILLFMDHSQSSNLGSFLEKLLKFRSTSSAIAIFNHFLMVLYTYIIFVLEFDRYFDDIGFLCNI